jgi:hypothetical protein
MIVKKHHVACFIARIGVVPMMVDYTTMIYNVFIL